MGDSWFWFLIVSAGVCWLIYLAIDWKRNGSP